MNEPNTVAAPGSMATDGTGWISPAAEALTTLGSGPSLTTRAWLKLPSPAVTVPVVRTVAAGTITIGPGTVAT